MRNNRNEIYSSVPLTFAKFTKADTEQSIPSRFEQQVQKYSGNIAIKTKTTTLTYQQLNQKANQIARLILTQKDSNQQAIALLLEQGADFIAAIFAVLKLGKIYIPLDAQFPRHRLEYILADSQAPLIITNTRNLALAQELATTESEIYNIDQMNPEIASENLDLEISPDTAAYIIYTSGSTGKPKGVLQSHRNVLHYCMNNTNAMHICSEDRMTLLYSCSVMGAVRCIFNSLLNGASLYTLNVKEEGLNQLVNLLIQEKITIYHSVATLFRHFIDILTGEEEFPHLRVIRLGGEAAVRRDVQLYRKYFPETCHFYASLGSTETGTTRHFLINHQTPIHTSTVPIGYPVEDVEILLLDVEGNPVKEGETGEIVVKSRYLALGYWGKPELTKAVFKPCADGTTLYHTGDLGRMATDGCLIHMGRKDFQVKIRGFRIELAEIEMALMDTGIFKETVVITREDTPGNTHLVAYLVTYPGKTTTVKELRETLQHQLPEYMVPTAFIFLERIPLTPNGKINRLALPVPEYGQTASEGSYIAPSDRLERELLELWEQVLGIQPIGMEDNFFELGGHSLMAIQLFAQIEKKFHKQLPLATLIKSATPRAIAKIIRQSVDDTYSSLVELKSSGSRKPLFLIHPLGGEILCYRDLVKYLDKEQPVYALQPLALDGKNPPHTSVSEMATHYLQAIRTIQPQGSYVLAGYSFGGIVAFEMAQQLHQQGEEIANLILLDTSRPGYSKRLPFLLRIPLHFHNFLLHGTDYLKEKIISWGRWKKHQLQEKYKQFLKVTPHLVDIATDLSEDDLHIQVIEANAEALSKYNFRPYPGSLTLLRTEDEERDPGSGIEYEPLFGWGEIVLGNLDVDFIPGSHLSILEEPHIQVLAEKLQMSLDKTKVKQVVVMGKE
ncbi:amino acid adenylation domain-containing protein [Calothrix sp. 336/3]|nr:amino acid adenylation domain-containing protein [Calothrix sp. 336/3]